MQRLWDNVIGAMLATGVVALVFFTASFVFLLRYGLPILVIGLGVWLGLSWFS